MGTDFKQWLNSGWSIRLSEPSPQSQCLAVNWISYGSKRFHGAYWSESTGNFLVLTSDQTKLEDEFILTQVTTNHLTSFELYMKEHEHLNLDGNHGFTMKKRFFFVWILWLWMLRCILSETKFANPKAYKYAWEHKTKQVQRTRETMSDTKLAIESFHLFTWILIVKISLRSFL